MPVMSLAVFGLAAVLLAIGIPVAVSLTLSSILVLVAFHPVPFDIIPLTIWSGVESYVMTAIPLFMLAGLIMEGGGLAERLFDFVEAVFSWMKGGVGHVNVASSLFFGGISGSSVADVAALGRIEMNLMKQNGYTAEYSAAMTAVTSTLAVLIPPSIMMVVVGVLSRQSIAALLLGGLGPGVLLAVVLMIVNYFVSVKQGIPASGRPDFRWIWRSFWHGAPVLVIPVLLVGGMVSGLFTPTEVAAVAVIYAMLVAYFLYHELNASLLYQKLVQTAKTTASILFILAGSTLFSWIISWDNITGLITQLLASFTQSPTIVLLIIDVILLIAGMFIDTGAALIILVPLIFPVGLKFGINPIHLGVVTVMAMSLGLVTPPYGLCLFTTAAVSELPIGKIVRAMWPLLGAALGSLLIATMVPQVATFLPSLFLK